MGGKFQGRSKLIADAEEAPAGAAKAQSRAKAGSPKAESRAPKAENPKTDQRKTKSVDRSPKTESPKAESRAPKTESPKTESPKTESRAPRSESNKPRVLVTGASGFIGSRLVAALACKARVRVLLLPGEEPLAVEGIEVVEGDVRDSDALARACQGVDRVFHLAARVGDWGSEDDFWTVNVDGTRNLLEAAASAGCRRVVMVSSIAVYGMQLRTASCDEERPRAEGVGPYSRSKSASEAIARDYHRRGDVEVVVVRPGNVFGPGKTPWVGELIRVLRKGQAPLIDSGTGDAQLAYVDNVVDVLVAASEHPDAGGKIYNAVDGHGVTWKQYIGDLARLAGAREPRMAVPHKVAWTAARALERFAKLRRSSERPLLTREAVVLLSSKHPIPNQRAIAELGYLPRPYEQCLREVQAYIDSEL